MFEVGSKVRYEAYPDSPWVIEDAMQEDDDLWGYWIVGTVPDGHGWQEACFNKHGGGEFRPINRNRAFRQTLHAFSSELTEWADG